MSNRIQVKVKIRENDEVILNTNLRALLLYLFAGIPIDPKSKPRIILNDEEVGYLYEEIPE